MDNFINNNLIFKTLEENISDPNTIFVFPTQTAAQLWAEKFITVSTTKAVAMERFTAWDSFKGNSIKSKKQNKTSIPSILRKVFATTLMEKNKDTSFLKGIILPEYSYNSGVFADYIESLLPSLSLWKNYFDKSNSEPDEEDKDLQCIYDAYNNFLNDHNFFDPAWETPPFEPDGNHYVIFFPEILSDYFEYEKILKNTPDITVINVPECNEEKPDVLFFNNSRTELKNVAGKLWDFHNDGISWQDMAISVPDMDSYGAYLDRELTINQIPHVMKYSKPLTSFGAGSLFTQIIECINSDFGYDSVRNLLLNGALPWGDKEVIQQLLSFGRKNHCICSFTYNNKKINVWEKSFAENPSEERIIRMFNMLRKCINDIANAEDFDSLREKYFVFRNTFFNMEECSEGSDLILSRCITGLTELIELQKKYNFSVSNPLKFFNKILDGTQYLAQSQKTGVQLYPYKLAAAAPFNLQIVIDSSQKGTSVIYEQLKFLREDKRRKILGSGESNASQQFIQLYTMNSLAKPAYFTAANKTFTGYAQTSSSLTEVSLIDSKKRKFSEEEVIGKNIFQEEKRALLDNETFPQKLTSIQTKGFENWKNQINFKEEEIEVSDSEIVKTLLNQENPKISTTQLKNFFDCPRLWLYKSVIGLNQEDNAAKLVDKWAMGNLYHKLFEIYCNKLKAENLVIHTGEKTLEEPYLSILNNSIDEAISYRDNYYYNSYLTKQLLETTKTSLVKTITESIHNFSKIFDGCTVAMNESSFSYENQEKGYTATGRIDCLLKSPLKDDYILVDFKSTANAIPSKNFYVEEDSTEEPAPAVPSIQPLEEQDLPDFQIPMYVYLLRNNKEKKIPVRNACFYDVSEGECYPVFGETLAERCGYKEDELCTVEAFEPTVEKLLDCIDYFIQKIKTGDLNLNQNVQNFSSCAGCDYKSICRKTFNVSRKE